MGRHSFHRLPRSIFFRLTAAIIVAGILMTVTVVGGFAYFQRSMLDTLQQSLSLYVRYLIKDIGNPPDLARARDIAAETGLVIQYRSPAQEWTVPEGARIPDLSTSHRAHRVNPRVRVGGGRRGHFISVDSGKGTLTFWRPRDDAVEEQHRRFFSAVCLILLFILAGAYLYIRRVMQPVRWLTEAMEQYSRGDLAYRMPLKRSDEFQDLAESVNHMAGRIQALLDSKEKLLLDVSHELRSPIARLKVGIAMLDDEAAKASLAEDLAEMAAMVTEILETARLRRSAAALNLQKVDSRAWISRLVSEYNAPRIRLGQVEACELSIDPQKMRTVFRNLFDNALKYSGENPQPVEVRARRDGEYYQITVEDHGIGIPADDLDRIFEPFFRVDPSRSRKTGGFGLGLSLCRAIMTAHGGDIRIESVPGQGTRVILRLKQHA